MIRGYTFSATAEAMAHLVDPADTVIVGHSFGGVVGLHLAGRPGVRAVVGFGIKVAWTPDELARAAKLAAREPARYDTRDEAVGRHLRVAGLDGLVDVDHPTAAAGVVEEDRRFRPALDPRAFGVGEPGVAALLAAAPVPVVLARGEHDALVSSEDPAGARAERRRPARPRSQRARGGPRRGRSPGGALLIGSPIFSSRSGHPDRPTVESCQDL